MKNFSSNIVPCSRNKGKRRRFYPMTRGAGTSLEGKRLFLEAETRALDENSKHRVKSMGNEGEKTEGRSAPRLQAAGRFMLLSDGGERGISIFINAEKRGPNGENLYQILFPQMQCPQRVIHHVPRRINGIFSHLWCSHRTDCTTLLLNIDYRQPLHCWPFPLTLLCIPEQQGQRQGFVLRKCEKYSFPQRIATRVTSSTLQEFIEELPRHVHMTWSPDEAVLCHRG